MKNYLKSAKTIVRENKLQNYVNILLDYWEECPTSLGHGFYHVLKVAVEAYEIGLLNNYPEPDHLFIGGLFHDIYRPAMGADGSEDQTKGAEIVTLIFNKNGVDEEITKKVVGAIKSHDSWIGSKNVPEYDLLLSIADKITHDTFLTDSYVWSSNKFYLKEHGKLKYTNHLATLYGFVKYQTRAWDLFLKHPRIGTERAIESYINIYTKTASAYLKDKEGEHFSEYLDTTAENFRKNEKKYLKLFGRSEESIKKIMATYY